VLVYRPVYNDDAAAGQLPVFSMRERSAPVRLDTGGASPAGKRMV